MKYKEFFNQNPVFTLDEYISAVQKNKHTAYNNLMSYITKGKVKSIRRGLYSVIPNGNNSMTYKPDEILIASRLSKDSILAYHSALEVLGYSHSLLYRYFYYTNLRKKKIYVGNREYNSIQVPAVFKNKSNNISSRILPLGFYPLDHDRN